MRRRLGSSVMVVSSRGGILAGRRWWGGSWRRRSGPRGLDQRWQYDPLAVPGPSSDLAAIYVGVSGVSYLCDHGHQIQFRCPGTFVLRPPPVCCCWSLFM